jgi:glutamate-1-semialdehyde 2,1-aminomutase
VRADMVTYGKTLGGAAFHRCGLRPRRPDETFPRDRPADICFARGTFNSSSVCHGRDAGVPRAPRDLRFTACTRVWTNCGTAGRNNSIRASRRRRCPCAVANLSSIWTVAIPGPRATTGCSSTTCAPRGLR